MFPYRSSLQQSAYRAIGHVARATPEAEGTARLRLEIDSSRARECVRAKREFKPTFWVSDMRNVAWSKALLQGERIVL